MNIPADEKLWPASTGLKVSAIPAGVMPGGWRVQVALGRGSGVHGRLVLFNRDVENDLAELASTNRVYARPRPSARIPPRRGTEPAALDKWQDCRSTRRAATALSRADEPAEWSRECVRVDSWLQQVDLAACTCADADDRRRPPMASESRSVLRFGAPIGSRITS